MNQATDPPSGRLVARVVRVKRTGINWLISNGVRTPIEYPYWILLDVGPASVHAFMSPKSEGRCADSWLPDLEDMISTPEHDYGMDDRG